ncbi:MAG TPA: indole-3-glycerol phosphate synthase TrpC [Acidimicrobiales bacterium]|nr:indole-3-glycerol phosphate synthase TrpC [Acidimicrobiales bacterium]
MATYLDRIVAWHRQRAEADHRRLADLRAAAAAMPPARGFAAALRAGEGVSVIAEVKRRSPSKGDLAEGLDPAEVAVDYAAGGAACLSVLTDGEFFGGSPSDLGAARSACALPVLRKDFTVSPRDVFDARLMGADAVLLIVAALRDDELADLAGLAGEVGLDALVEVHDEAEADRALAAGAVLVGVNQRDLVSFEVDTERAARVAAHLPATAVRVAESGIRNGADVAALAAAGFDAVLVGESLVTAADRVAAVRGLRTPAPAR